MYGVVAEGARALAELRSGDGPLSVRIRPSSLKRDCARRTTSTCGKCLVSVHAKSHLTINEVRHAREISTDLYVVDHIRLERLDDGTIRTSGGRIRPWPNWAPNDASLSPTRYRYQLPG